MRLRRFSRSEQNNHRRHENNACGLCQNGGLLLCICNGLTLRKVSSAKDHFCPLRSIRQRMRELVVNRQRAVKSAGTAIQTAARSVRAAASKSFVTVLSSGGTGVAVAVILIVGLLGSVLSMIGGDNVSATSLVSAEVLTYEPAIRLYAAQYHAAHSMMLKNRE